MNWEEILTGVVNTCIDIAWKLLLSAVVFFVGRFIIKLIIKFFPNGQKHNHIDPTARTFIESFIKIALNCVLIVTIVAIMGVPMASVVTVFATAGAAIALAVQGSFSNMMGGIMLLIFRPVAKGDYIEVDGSKSGTVYEVGIFYTVLKTPDNLTVSIPNGTMTSSTIVNYSREENRRVDVAFDVGYGSDIDEVKGILSAVIESCEFGLKDPEPAILFTNMKDSSVEITVRVWAPASKYFAVKEYLLTCGKDALEKANVEIPFTQLDVNIINR